MFVCDGGFYAEQLVAECLGIPVFAVVPSPILPGPGSPPPFFGLRPARTIVGRAPHSVVRRVQASTLKGGVKIYNDLLAANGVAPIAPDGFPAGPMSSAHRVFLNGCPGLEFPGYQPPANGEFVGHLRTVRGASAAATELPPAVVEPGRTRGGTGGERRGNPGRVCAAGCDRAG